MPYNSSPRICVPVINTRAVDVSRLQPFTDFFPISYSYQSLITVQIHNSALPQSASLSVFQTLFTNYAKPTTMSLIFPLTCVLASNKSRTHASGKNIHHFANR